MKNYQLIEQINVAFDTIRRQSCPTKSSYRPKVCQTKYFKKQFKQNHGKALGNNIQQNKSLYKRSVDSKQGV